MKKRFTPNIMSFTGRGGRLIVTAVLAALLPVMVTFAQVQTPKNPYPRDHGNVQNRGRAISDLFWGIFDGNREYPGYVASRSVENDSLTSPDSVGRTGWAFPRPIPNFDGTDPNQQARHLQAYIDATDTLKSYVQVDDIAASFPTTADLNSVAPSDARVVTTNPLGLNTLNPYTGGISAAGTSWNAVTGPGANYIGNGYHSSTAITRTRDNVVNPGVANVYTWGFSIPGVANEMKRYQIVVHLPDVASGNTEARISDAHYKIYYAIRITDFTNIDAPITSIKQQTRDVFLDQRTGGDQVLKNPDGSVAYFSFASDAFYGGFGGQPAQITLDNTTNNDGANLTVVADSIKLVQQQDIVLSTPTTTPRHGGRKVIVGTPAAGVYPPSAQPRRDRIAILQKDGAGNPIVPQNDDTGENGSTVPIGGSYDANDHVFINDLDDPIRIPTDPKYDTASPYFPLETDNISVFYQAASANIDPRTPYDATVKNFRPTNEAQNNELYTSATTGVVTPFFSHMQVIEARTEYVQNPGTTQYIEVGCVYGLDWLTGTPIWRFPDKSYLPGGPRNPLVTKSVGGGQVPTIPGIGAYDKNMDGIIQDDEVFIVGQGSNSSGGISASVTIVPDVPVQGDVKLPVIATADTFTNGRTLFANITTKPAQAGRYYDPATFKPVPVSVAYVASHNGVVYAIDMNGNNDNKYFPNTADTTRRGLFRHGSTNCLWTFSALSGAQSSSDPITGQVYGNETQETYFKRLKSEVPATGSFNAAPTIAFQNPTGNPMTDEQRMFIGNDNGLIYALDAGAKAGVILDATNTVVGVKAMPFRKGISKNPDQSVSDYAADLKWWFETRGAIKASPAVSQAKLDAQDPIPTVPATTLVEKGVYVTTLEGRIYCIDWTGPVTKTGQGASGSHTDSRLYDGTATTAQVLNDNYRFHNSQPATTLARADNKEGEIRPRWVFPQLYRNIVAKDILFSDPADKSRAATSVGIRLAEPQNLASIQSAPVLMDFVWQDPQNPGIREMRHYIVLAANDPVSTGLPTEGKIYLLDEAGDRSDFTTNPRVLGTGALARAFSRPLDQYLPHEVVASASPTWSYRYNYDRYDAAGNAFIQERNAPIKTLTTQAQPSRRTVPTVFVGGVGQVWAIDIDPLTGAFMRWRKTVADEATVMPIRDAANGETDDPTDPQLPFRVPNDESVRDLLDPVNPTVLAKGLNLRPVLAHVYPLSGANDGSEVLTMMVSGGPLQNRNIEAGTGISPLTLPTPPLFPTNDAPYYVNLLPEVLATPAAADQLLDLLGRYVNQDINDPLTTTRGSTSIVLNNGTVDYIDPVQSRSFQYPVLFVTTVGGGATPSHVIEMSTNLDAEQRTFTDPAVTTSANGESATLGWALTTFSSRLNNQQILQMKLQDIGGQGGISLITNAYLESLDSDYRNTVPKTTAAGVPTDPSYQFPAYPPGQPNLGSPNPGLFNPRGIQSGVVGAPGVTAVTPDRHTGLTGFPLDSNGLFYDKSFAVDPNSTVIGNPTAPFAIRTTTNINPLDKTQFNGDGRVRLPGYSAIGAAGGANGVPNLFTNELADGLKSANPLNTTAQQLIDPLTGVIALNPTTNPPAPYTDDVNPASTYVAWMYVPGADGVLYGITPFKPGGNTGRFGGSSSGDNQNSGDLNGIVDEIPNDLTTTGAAKVAIFDKADYDALFAAVGAGTSVRPDIDGRSGENNYRSRAAKGKHNFFEWGETIYLVIFDALGNTSTGPANGAGTFAAGNSIRLTFTNKTRGSTFTQDVAIRGTYAYKPIYEAPQVTRTPAQIAAAAALGIAFKTVTLDTSSTTVPNTPGDIIEVSATQTVQRVVNGRTISSSVTGTTGGGAIEAERANNLRDSYAAANPLAVQAFLTDTQNGQPVNLGTGNVNADANNSVGPLALGDQVKEQYIDRPAADGTDDPDRIRARYSQAITNGNSITRRSLNAYAGSGGGGVLPRLNRQYQQRSRDTNGAVEPTFFVPVAAGAGYGNPGDSATTDRSNTQRNLRIINRSYLANLPSVRVASAEILWRYWPGQVPNYDADDTVNPRRTPKTGAVKVMGDNGVINPLPWEQLPTENRPYANNVTAQARTVVGNGQNNANLLLGNASSDYPNIPQTDDGVRVQASSGDLVKLNSTLISPIGNPLAGGTAPSGIINFSGSVLDSLAVSASIKIPTHQPANLVAMHSLTSTYEAASTDDIAVTGLSAGGISGPTQLPRNIGNVGSAPRPLKLANSSIQNAITPWGYTLRLIVYVDTNGDGKLTLPTGVTQPTTGVDRNNRSVTAVAANNGAEAYRVVEIWLGVPVDLGLATQQALVDFGARGHGFGLQNGLLGYGQGSLPRSLGFLPNPLDGLPNSYSTGAVNPYDTFFKTFNVQNKGNVNLWNLRASQRIEDVSREAVGDLGSGKFLTYLAMKSIPDSNKSTTATGLTDPRFGISAMGADPLAFNTTGLMPQVVTSLDISLDGEWDAYLKNQGYFTTAFDDGNGTTASLYNRYYASLGSRHTLHKPLPGTSEVDGLPLLSIPDRPERTLIPTTVTAGGFPIAPPITPRVGVAVPIGTPADIYSTSGTGTPFTIFEDHDTPNTGYQPVPRLAADGVTILPAGPLYNGHNDVVPGKNPILPAGGYAESTFRPRRLIQPDPTKPPQLEYLPYVSPTIVLQTKVVETALTGQIPDRLSTTANLNNIVAGLLPNADLFPAIDTAATGGVRAASSLTPAGYRTTNGQLHIYFSSNSIEGNNRVGQSQPTDPFRLFQTHLNWDAAAGTWKANSIGTPISDPTANTGRWFTQPKEVAVGVAPTDTNTSPFVLENGDNSTLFWLNSRPVAGASPVTTIYWASLDGSGNPNGATPYLTKADPSLRRYQPRAINLGGNTTVVFYYGGTAGRFNVFYAPAPSDANGRPTADPQEQRLTLPNAVSSASDPMPIVRQIRNQQTGNLDTVVDVYYTAVTRAKGQPTLYMTRFGFGGQGRNLRLVPLTLPFVAQEALVKPTGTRDSVYAAVGTGWSRNQNSPITLPVIYLQAGGAGAVTPLTVAANWSYDTQSGLLYQSFSRTIVNPITGANTPTLNFVYVDTSAGTVRFRGLGIPNGNDKVFADYQPATLRVSNQQSSGVFGFFDSTVLTQTTAANTSNSVLRRPIGDVPNDRQWLFWQVSSSPDNATIPSTLYSTIRRVGISLRAIPVTATTGLVTDSTDSSTTNETILLSAPDANGNQLPAINVSLSTDTGVVIGAVPFDVDIATGRIYFSAQWEGYIATVNYTATSKNGGAVNKSARFRLAFIQEIGLSSGFGNELSVTKNINEGQPYAFLDRFDPRGLVRNNPLAPPSATDPTLQPGRVWLFWSSPRPRQGLLTNPTSLIDTTPNSFEVYWETIAPNFAPSSSSLAP